MHIATPPTKGIFPVWAFRPEGLSTRPIFFATFLVKNNIAKAIVNVKSKSINIVVSVVIRYL